MNSINSSKQEGAALFVSLILLLVLTVVGLSSAQRSNLQEKMASNTHMQNIAFNASESALGGFIYDANDYTPTTNPMLAELRTNGSLPTRCYNQLGERVECDGAFLDGDKSSAIISQMDATVVNDCFTPACSGFSLGEATASCRLFRVDAQGQVGNATVSTTLWAYEVSADFGCN